MLEVAVVTAGVSSALRCYQCTYNMVSGGTAAEGSDAGCQGDDFDSNTQTQDCGADNEMCYVSTGRSGMAVGGGAEQGLGCSSGATPSREGPKQHCMQQHFGSCFCLPFFLSLFLSFFLCSLVSFFVSLSHSVSVSLPAPAHTHAKFTTPAAVACRSACASIIFRSHSSMCNT